MRFYVVLPLLSICLVAILSEAHGQSFQSPQYERDASTLRVQTISVKRGPLFNSSRTTGNSDVEMQKSPGPARSTTIRLGSTMASSGSASVRQEWTVDPRSDNSFGAHVIVNEPPTSTMIEHVIVAPDQARPSAYQKYNSPWVTQRASDAISSDYLASETYDDGWNAWQPCCEDLWSDMCPCCEVQWDCGCCDTSPFAWLNRSCGWLNRSHGKCATHCGVGPGSKKCRHCRRGTASCEIPFGPSTGTTGEWSVQPSCDTAPTETSSPSEFSADQK